MSAPVTFNNFPVVRVATPPMSDELYAALMQRYSKMYARFNTPHTRPWPASEVIIGEKKTGRLARENQKIRTHLERMRALQQRAKHMSDTPRFLPFTGACFHRWIDRLTIWYLKRQQHQAEDYHFHHGRNHPSFG